MRQAAQRVGGQNLAGGGTTEVALTRPGLAAIAQVVAFAPGVDFDLVLALVVQLDLPGAVRCRPPRRTGLRRRHGQQHHAAPRCPGVVPGMHQRGDRAAVVAAQAGCAAGRQAGAGAVEVRRHDPHLDLRGVGRQPEFDEAVARVVGQVVPGEAGPLPRFDRGLRVQRLVVGIAGGDHHLQPACVALDQAVDGLFEDRAAVVRAGIGAVAEVDDDAGVLPGQAQHVVQRIQHVRAQQPADLPAADPARQLDEDDVGGMRHQRGRGLRVGLRVRAASGDVHQVRAVGARARRGVVAALGITALLVDRAVGLAEARDVFVHAQRAAGTRAVAQRFQPVAEIGRAAPGQRRLPRRCRMGVRLSFLVP